MLTKNIKKGFSLVELLVVITIIAILSVVAYSAVGGQTIKARDSKRKQDLNTIQSALELYFVEFGTYPDSLENGAIGDGKIPKKFLSSIPTDPGADTAYIYATDGISFAIAATLENDGRTINYEAYVVGNSDDDLILFGFGAPDAKHRSGDDLVGCAPPGKSIVSGTIGEAPGLCIPYPPYTP